MSALIALQLAAALLAAVLWLWPTANQRPAAGQTRRSVALVVLGDIGRSPRMIYHAQSLVAAGFKTYIVAYAGSKAPASLSESPLVEFVYLPTPLPWVAGLPRAAFLAFAPLKVLVGAASLLHALLYRIQHPPGFLFVQNPPAIPTLPLASVAARLRRSKLVIDWHNTGYSVLSLRLGTQHPVVRVARWIEHTFGRNAFAHLCVTAAMRTMLLDDIKLNGHAVVYHDRPPAGFRRQTVGEAHELFARLAAFTRDSLPADFFPAHEDPLATPFTLADPLRGARWLEGRPALLTSATSWTADEDFSVLLRALELYEAAARVDERLPRLVVVVTGKGALKAAFEREVAQLEGGEDGWRKVRVRTAWLEREDYPRLLGSADLAVSLHDSTSGADLPMKVVDAFGCGLPAVAQGFACIDELVQDGVNGRTFGTPAELADRLEKLLSGFPAGTSGELERLSRGITADETRYAGEKWDSWESHWNKLVLPLLQ